MNYNKPRQWEGAGESAVLQDKDLQECLAKMRYEVTVFTPKKTFSFKCEKYVYRIDGAPVFAFDCVIIDTSKVRQVPGGKEVVELYRYTYHPEIVLVNVPLMVIPIGPEGMA